MTAEIMSLDLGAIRGTDSNSLLRLYDRAHGIATTSASQQERSRADKALRRITKELEKRKISLERSAPAAPIAAASTYQKQ